MNKLSWYQIIDSSAERVFRILYLIQLIWNYECSDVSIILSNGRGPHHSCAFGQVQCLVTIDLHLPAWSIWHIAGLYDTLLLGWSANQKSARSVLLSLLQLCHNSSMLRSNPYRCKECSDVSTITSNDCVPHRQLHTIHRHFGVWTVWTLPISICTFWLFDTTH